MSGVESLHGTSAYLDSNVFIYALEGQVGPLRSAAAWLLRVAYDGSCVARTSLVSRAEALVRPLRMHQVTLADRYRGLLSGSGPVLVYALDERVIEFAAGLRADYPSLKLVDALHVATAVRTGCDVLITADRRLATVAARIQVVPLDSFAKASDETS